MISEQQILDALDHSNDGYYCSFLPLNAGYSYLIVTRLNLFRSEDEWAIAAEIVGFNPRGGWIDLSIYYHGNCLINLETYNNRHTNYYSLSPIDEDSFREASLDEMLDPAASEIFVRGIPIALSHERANYLDAGIDLLEVESNSINWEEVGRLLITQHQGLFRATDEELYKSIPKHLKKIMVLDEWHHKDFTVGPQNILSDEDIERTYNLNKEVGGLQGMSLADLTATIRSQDATTSEYILQEWTNSRPSSYETWQQLAKVLATGNTSFYQPTLAPNTHWSNWPESGWL
ncbi:DUF7003 family protein [Hymenobacter volaticus]|uniref:Uncharacterized protein n=1 Tax=Hymenobacter volaticus TaxID=2932254 RepID=A0ABY4GAP9_9BACT|nr:hypothetical protein [Hymenobacter volaticus]UOQ67871.1 hypothetical protein MUN86_08435 [Hymenobacter volaticus]